MGTQVEHLGHDDPVEPFTEAVERLDSHAEIAHGAAQLDRITLEGRELAEP